MLRAKNWSAITYEFFTPDAEKWAQRNYLDWPLYFVNTYLYGLLTVPALSDLSGYYIPLGTLSTPAPGVYALQCPAGAVSASAIYDGTDVSYPCNQDVTRTRIGSTVMPDDGAVVLQPVRFVFPWDGTCNVVSVCS